MVFDSNNWIIVVKFTDGNLTAVRVRTEDDFHLFHPEDAPEDILPDRFNRN